MLVEADIDNAVQEVNAGVVGLNGRGDGVTLLVAANGVVAHVKRQLLLVVEDILNDKE